MAPPTTNRLPRPVSSAVWVPVAARLLLSLARLASAFVVPDAPTAIAVELGLCPLAMLALVRDCLRAFSNRYERFVQCASRVRRRCDG
jgi:hypothetical protein